MTYIKQSFSVLSLCLKLYSPSTCLKLYFLEVPVQFLVLNESYDVKN